MKRCKHCGEFFCPSDESVELISEGYISSDNVNICDECWEKETISTLVKEINAPINILSNPGIGAGLPPSVRELQDLGVARLSLGSSLNEKQPLTLTIKVSCFPLCGTSCHGFCFPACRQCNNLLAT